MFKNCLKLILIIFKIQITDNYLSNAGISKFFCSSLFIYISRKAIKKKRIHFLSLMIAAANTAEDN